MKNLLSAAGVAIALLAPPAAARAAGVSPPFMQKIVDQISLEQSWGSIEVEVPESWPSNVVTLWYKEERPVSTSQAKDDTNHIALQIIKALVAAGHDPEKEQNQFLVLAKQVVIAGTVRPRPAVLWIGATNYVVSHDALEWAPNGSIDRGD
jgi:hypothetical protein